MEKVIFFESNEGRLHRCIFAGLDNNNRPQWVMVDQCDEMMTLQDYMDANSMKDEDMRVLCLEGETLESTTLAQLLGAVLQGYPFDNARALSEAIKNLKEMGIVWKHEKLQLEVRAFEYYDEVNLRNEYRFYIYCSGYGPILEMDNIVDRAKTVLKLLHRDLQLVELKNQIQDKSKHELDRQQREYFLNQQMKTIQEELGGSPSEKDYLSLQERGAKKKWNQETAEIFRKELEKLQRTNPMAPDYSVQLNYLELFVDLPWNEYSKDNFNLNKARKVLDKDHYGLEKVKERILEYLAVLKLKGDMKSPILCLAGPPGVGKTSLGKSIAAALGRKYVRVSLGGLRDESEIRGHRKTYIGAMPGRIIQNMRKAGFANPVFVLDEIDKITGMNVQGDPSAALLEVMDPEQNNAFYDNYLETSFDLSRVLFIATANNLNNVHPALLDRMEIIDIAGYLAEEKLQIAKKHLIPKHRLSVDLTYLPDQMCDFYGFNGYQSEYNAAYSNQDDAAYISRAYYKYHRDLFRFSADMQGSISKDLYWNAGIGLLLPKEHLFQIVFFNEVIDIEL